MTNYAFDKAKKIDDKYTMLMWEEFRNLVKETYQIKNSSTDEVFIKVPKAENFDIEIYPKYDINVHKFSVNLWDNRNGHNVIESEEVDSLSSIIMKIDEYIKEVPGKLKYDLQ